MLGLGSNKLHLISLEDPHSVHSEMYRSIRTNIEYSSVDKQIKVINVTSSSANEAKTTTAGNMAVMAANKYKNVLLIDLDLRSATVHHLFNIKNQIGLTDLLVDFLRNGEQVDLSKYIKKYTHEHLVNPLAILTVGTDVVNPTEILSSKKLKELILFLRDHYDEIIIDSAPGGIITDGILASTIAEGTVFIIESGKTKIDMAKKTLDQLKSANVNILGVVLTKVPFRTKKYGYYYGYGNNQTSDKDRIKIDIE